MAFRIASSPYTHNHRSTRTVMTLVMLATLPGIAVQYYYFGCGNLIQLLIAICTAWLAEAMVLTLRHMPVRKNLADNSAILTALLLAISLPPLAPWWLVVIGTLFAIIIAKQLYGGLGHNPFNPAMVGYVVLLISFPVQMTHWLAPTSLATPPDLPETINAIFSGHSRLNSGGLPLHSTLDGISQATPLDTLKTGLRAGHTRSELLEKPLFGGILAGLGWQWVNVAFLAGGLFLLATRCIRWHIPVSFLLTLTFCATTGWLLSPSSLASPGFHLFSGATMLGAFFIATDPVTASTTNTGRLIFGALTGALVWLIRSYGGYPDGVAFAVLLGNIIVPLIDYYTKPRVYGHRKE